MAEQSLKDKTVKGVIWSSVERFSIQGIQFVIGIVLARLLSPAEFGLIGMLSLFMALSNSLIDSGFGNALIQKYDRNEKDYSTVFYFNIVVSVLIYLVMYLAAPLIAEFYSTPELIAITRVLSINFIFNSLILVQKTKLTIELNFGLQTKIRLSACVLSGIMGISLAFNGYGVWALVSQSLLFALIETLLIWIFARWKPSLVFSINSFKSLFRFGSRLLLTGLYGPIFENINTLIIGKFYPLALLGYYTRAQSLAEFPSSNITAIINRVSYPVLSSIQNDDDRLLSAYRKLIKQTYFIVFPLILGLMVVSDNLVDVLFTSKWLGCVPYLRVICLSMSLYPICAYNINILLVKGRPGLHLKLDVIKKIFVIFVLLVTANISVMAMCYGSLLSSFFSWGVTAWYSGKLLRLSMFSQIADMLHSFTASIIMVIAVYMVNLFCLSSFVTLILQIVFGALIYIAISFFVSHDLLYNVVDVFYGNYKKSN